MKFNFIFGFILCLAWLSRAHSQITSFSFTGGMETYIVPAGVTSIQIETWGAQGGSSVGLNGASAAGGLGGYSIGVLEVVPGQILHVYVGGQGGAFGPGGYNGGGQAGSYYGAAGGGASDVRISPYGLLDRVIVGAGGGGGSFGTYGNEGGDGGGLIGAAGEPGPGFSPGEGGTQVSGGNGGCCYPGTANGTFGQGGGTGAYHNAGGGGGWYGGGSGAGYAGAGGGSSYIGGVTDGGLTPGVRSGDGRVVITVNCDPLTVTISTDELCLGEEVVFTASSVNGGALSWDGGVVNAVPFTPDISGVLTFTVTSDDPEDCYALAQIEVFPLPEIIPSVDHSTICFGESVTFEEDGDADSYEWDPPEVESGVPYTPPVGLAEYTLVGTNETTGCMNEATIEVEVFELPIISAGSDISLCIGDSVFLAGDGAGIDGSYAWDGGIIDGEYFEPLTSAEYTVTGTDSNGCVGEDDIMITVFDLPVIEAGLNDTICFGAEVIFSATGLLDPEGYEWSDDIENGIPFIPIISGTYFVIGTDENGCENIDSLEVIVNSLPSIEAGEDQSICFGFEIVLSASGAGLGGVYDWTDDILNDDPFIPTETNMYYVTGTDENGCQNLDSVMVEVFDLPIIFAGDDESICSGDSIILTGAGAGVDGLYLWSGGVMDGTYFTPDITADYILTGTDSNGCENKDTITVTINPLPIIEAGMDITICASESVVLEATGAGTEGIYSWEEGIENGVNFMPTTTGYYHVTGEDANGCSSQDSVYLLVNPIPLVNAGDDQTVCIEGDVTLSAEDTVIDNLYTWSNGVVNDSPFTVYNISQVTYTLTVTDSNGCENSDEVMVNVINCDTILVFPSGFSPNNDGVNDLLVFTGIPMDLSLYVAVFNEWGMLLYEAEDYQNDWDGTNELGTSFQKGIKLPTGTYYYIAKYGDKVIKNYLYIQR